MNRLATATVSTLGAVHAGLNRKEDTSLDRLFDLSCEVDEAIEVIVRPERVELMMSRLLRLCEHVEPEHGIRAVLLLVGIAKRRSLKITVGFSFRPVR